MKHLLVWGVFVALVAVTGCQQSDNSAKSAGESGGGVDVQWPGGSVEIDPKEGVKVKAPGVEIKADKEQGVGVKAPGVDVTVQKDDQDDE